MLVKGALLLVHLVACALGANDSEVDGATDHHVLEKRNPPPVPPVPPDPNIWLHNTPAPSAIAAQINAGSSTYGSGSYGYGIGYSNYYGYGYGNYGYGRYGYGNYGYGYGYGNYGYGYGYGYGYYGKRR
ncbi:hypothetical protein L596_012747 [Steinernema carpocapsae]|uniref:Uncharacterized protein n=1 Tax=Steinernema carpocapsae TaxID=34508 RepID=A0A4U5NY16_STECR|nr:hypothetical protein L596_012747 [Steinernema carpocapsae]